jgi:F-type H+-transporting ATPase subunit delta
VTSRGAAVRYARALFDTTLAEQRDVLQMARDLRGFAALGRDHAALGRALTNPAIPAARKRAVVEQLIERSGGLQPPLAKLLLLLADRDRLAILPELAQAFDDRLMDYQKVVRAELVTAMPIGDDKAQAVKAGLARATGREVQLATRVDPSILGGAVARIGSTVYDGSVTRQLERLRGSLASAQ